MQTRSSRIFPPRVAQAWPHLWVPRAADRHEDRILSETKAAHVLARDVMLPNLLGQASISKGVVHPLTTVAPAPMVLGDFGVRNTTCVATPT